VTAPDRLEALIRPATSADLAQAFAVTWRCDEGPDVPVPTEAWRLHYLEHELATGTMGVAEAGGDVVGFGGTVERGSVTMLTDLYVDPRWHGHGIGARILESVLDDAWPRHTFASAHPNALPLYVRAGMAPRWIMLYLTGDPSVLHATASMSAAAGTDPMELAELEASWGRGRPEDHAYWSTSNEAVSIGIRRGERLVGYAYLTVEGRGEREWWVTSMSVAPDATLEESAGAVGAVLGAAVAHGIRSLGVALPGPHPATVPLLRAGWRIRDRDVYAASEPGLLDPERRLPDPTFA